MDSDSDSLQRYADIYNRVNDMYAMLAGKEPASVRETAFVTSMEAQNFFYIWATQGARAADAYYTQNVYAAARNRQAQAEAGYQQRQAEMRAQEAAMQPQSIPAPAAATPPLPQQSAQGNAATPPAPPVPQNAAQRPTESGGLRLTPKLSSGYNSLTQRQDVAWGENDTTWTEGNRPVEFTYAVVPLDSLIISNDKYGGVNKGYPAELQPRDRERATSQGQVQGMASGLVPQKLAASATAQNGAPLIRGDGVVIGGNGRSAAISLAYEKGMAGAYESFIRENGSRYGVDTRNLPKNPVLVRVVNGDEDWRNLAQELNVSSTAAYSATETAQTDATKIGDVLGLLVPNNDGDINTAANQDFIQAFVNRVVPANERGRMQTPAGLLSQDGLDRAINAIFAYAYGDTKLLTQFSEDLDPDMKNVINALAQSAPAVAALQSAIQEGSAYDIPARDTLLEALSIYRDARQEGKSVIEYLRQGDMLRQMNAEAAFIAGFIEQNKSSAKQLRFLFSALMQEVLDYGSPDQGSMFGGEDHDIQTALNGAVRRYGELSGKHLQRRSLEKPGGEQAAPGGGGGAQQTESLPADGGNRAGDEEDAGTGGARLPGAVRGEVAPQEEDAGLRLQTEPEIDTKPLWTKTNPGRDSGLRLTTEETPVPAKPGQGLSLETETAKEENRSGQQNQEQPPLPRRSGDRSFRERAEIAARQNDGRSGRRSGLGRWLEDLRTLRSSEERIAEQRRESTRLKNAAAVGDLTGISGAEAGIEDGSNEQTAFLMPESLMSDAQKEAIRRYAEQGFKLRFIIGQLGTTSTSRRGDPISVRAHISDNGDIYVQADHRRLSWEQLLDHEELHREIENNPALRQKIMDALLSNKQVAPQLLSILNRYAEAYADMGITDENKVVDELLCDYKAGFDMLDAASKTARERMGDYRTKAAARETIRAAEQEAGQKAGTAEAETAQSSGTGRRASIEPTFTSSFQQWVQNGRPGGTYINVGVTPDKFSDIGIKPRRFSWDTSKLNEIQKKHPYMTDDIVQQASRMIDDPVVILASKTQPNSAVFFGEVYVNDENGNPIPVMAALQLTPTRNGYTIDEYKIASIYAREQRDIPSTKATQDLLDSSEFLYVNPDKKRTQDWLRLTRLQLPFMPEQYGFIHKISLVSRDVNGNFSSGNGNVLAHTDMQ